MKALLLLALVFFLAFNKSVVANEDVVLRSEFRLETIASNLGLATGFAFAPENRIFVTTKEGVVRVVQDGILQVEPFIDLIDIVNDAGDRGLTDVAVHPDFPAKPYIYVAYVYDPPELNGMSGLAAPDARGRRVSRLTRFTANQSDNYNQVLPGSELHIVGANSRFETMGTPGMTRDQGEISCMQGDAFIADCLPSDDYSHVVGSIQFAEDGSLYMGYGDGATVAPYALALTLRTLDLDSLAGKILRVNPENGQAYSDNPFYDGDPNSNRSKVVNLGLRNPYGFTVDSLTNKLFMADTGWTSWEELNEGRGRNYGWPCYEGANGVNNRQPVYARVCSDYLDSPHNVSPPLFAYEHANKGGAITGLEIYQGDDYPQKYKGALFYNDFVRSEVSVVTLDDGTFQAVSVFASQWPGISKIRRGPDDNLYFLNIFEGTLSRLVYGVDISQLPIAIIKAEPSYGDLPLRVKFNALSSSDPLGGELSYHWAFGDGTSSDLATPEHVYQTKGVYNVTLDVTSSSGFRSTADFSVYAGTAPPVQIEFVKPVVGEVYANGEEVRFEALVSSNDASFDVSQATFVWRATVSNVVDQALPLEIESELQGNLIYPELAHDAEVNLCLLVTTDDGLETQRCTILKPLLATVLLQSEPSGLTLTFNGQEVVTPYNGVAHVGGNATLSSLNNTGYRFKSWSNNRSQTHSILVSEAGVMVTAVFVKSKGGGSFGIGFLLLLLGGLIWQARSVRRITRDGAEKRT